MEESPIYSKPMKRKLRRKATKTAMKKLKADELRLRINQVYVESSDSNLGYEISDSEEIANFDEGYHVATASENNNNSDTISLQSDEQVAEEIHIMADMQSGLSESSSLSDRSEVEENAMVFRNVAQMEQFVIESVRAWASESGVLSMSKVDNLLKRLSVGLPNMPKSYKTLLKNNFNLEISNLESGGKMWYKGFKVNLDQMLLQDYLQIHGKIIIDINIDGLPLFKSSKLKFWPILGHLVGTLNEPFIIAVYCGKSDPQNIEEYLEKYVNELEDLFHNGYEYEGNNYEVVIRNYVLDAPARAFIKCCKGHSGYASCEKCTIIGEYNNHRITFVDLNQPPRTDESFRNREQPQHHEGISPLERLGTGLVSQFRLDAMHLLYIDTYPQAREAVSGFLVDSNYETEIEQNMGRGKRKRKARPIRSDSDTDDSSVLSKITTKIIPALPTIPFKKVSSDIQNCDIDSDASISSKLLKSSSNIKLNNKKPKKEKMIVKRKERSSKHSYATELKKVVQTAKTIAASKMKRPESLASFSKTKSLLKSSTSCNSLLINSPVNCDESTVQEGMTFSLNVQSLTQVPDSSDGSTLTKDLTSTDHQPISTFNIDSADTAQCSSDASNCNDTPKSSRSNSSYRRTLFKEQLHDKNTENTSNIEIKVNRTLITVEEISGKLDILNMNVSKLMRAIIPSEKRISRPERMPALPLHTKQHLKEFETFLQADHNLAAACHYMSNHMKLGAKNPERKSATNMLTKLLSNTLAGEMNCDGGNGKIAFKTLKLYNLFQGTLQIAFPDSDLTEADAALAGWLKDAKWRKQRDGSLGNRNKDLQKNK